MTAPTPTSYFWDKSNNKALEHFGGTSTEDVPEMFWGKFCVDVTEASPSRRYGEYIKRNGPWDGDWKPLSLEDFPKEFRVQLLLLGVA